MHRTGQSVACHRHVRCVLSAGPGREEAGRGDAPRQLAVPVGYVLCPALALCELLHDRAKVEQASVDECALLAPVLLRRCALGPGEVDEVQL